MNARVTLFALVVALAGCAPLPAHQEPLPKHPFPRWVAKLEVGKSDTKSVRRRFGDPDAIEMQPTGAIVFRYRYPEYVWPDADPDRPVVGADGRVVSAPRPKSQDVRDSVAYTRSWIERLLFFPPEQPRPVRRRSLPATLHDLELEFDAKGRLVHYRYETTEGHALVRKRL